MVSRKIHAIKHHSGRIKRKIVAHKHRIDKINGIAIFGSLICFIAFALLISSSGLTLKNVTNITNVLSSAAISANFLALKPFLYGFVAMIMFAAGLTFLSSYGFYRGSYKIGFVSIIPAILIVLLLGLSIFSGLLALAVVISSIYVIPLANTYGMELRRWRRFRVGSKSVGRILIVFNVILALAVMLSVSVNPVEYQQDFKNSLKELMIASVQVPDALKPLVEAELDQRISDMPLFQAYVRWLPLVSAFSFWVGLEFLRALILSSGSGMISYVLIRIMHNPIHEARRKEMYEKKHGK